MKFKLGPVSFSTERKGDVNYPGVSPAWDAFMGISNGYQADKPITGPSTYLKAHDRSHSVYAALDVIVSAAHQVPLGLYAGGRGKDKREVEAHPLLDILEQPNPFTSGEDFLRLLITSEKLRGEAFVHPVLNKAGLPAELYLIPADAVQVIHGKDAHAFVEMFKVQGGNGQVIEFGPEEMYWYLRPSVTDPYRPSSALSSLRESINSEALAMSSHMAVFEGGALAVGAFSPKSEMGADATAVREMARDYRERMGGASKAHSVAFFQQGMEYQKLGLSAEDALWLATRTQALGDIAAAFHVPLPLITGASASYDNFRTAKLDLYQSNIGPLMKTLAGRFNRTVVRAFDPTGRLGLRFEPKMDVLDDLSYDTTRAAQLLAEVKAGVRTVNEVRAIEGRPPVTWGDSYWGLVTEVALDKGDGTPGVPFPRETVSLALPESTPAAKSAVSNPTAQTKATLPVIRTPEARAAVGIRHAEALDRISATMSKAVRTALTEQRDAIVAKLPAKRKSLDATALYVPAKKALLAAATTTLAHAGAEAYASVSDQIKGHKKDAGSPLAFSLDDEAIVAIYNKIGQRITGIDDLTRTDVQDTVAEGLRRGYSTSQIADGVPDENYPGIKGMADFSDARADTIARSETTYAFGQTTLSAYDKAGVEKKEWLTGVGGDQCDIDGEIVDLADDFSLGVDAPPAHPNCTCSVLPIMPDKSDDSSD